MNLNHADKPKKLQVILTLFNNYNAFSKQDGS